MNMSNKGLMLAVAIALGGVAATHAPMAQARVSVEIYAPTPPPPLRVERVPGPRHGYTWAPGYWAWNHNRYGWRKGHYVRERHGYVYNAPRWEQDGNRWRYHRERWDH